MTDWTGRTALVTGGAGFIGSHLVDRLVDEGARVRVLDDFSTGRQANLARSAEAILVHRGDLRDADTLRGALTGCDTVFHLAAIPSVPRSVDEPEHTHAVNVTGTLALLQACRELGVRRLVLAASCAAYGNDPTLPKSETLTPHPESPYASQKLMCEEYCRLYASLYDLETVSLRFFNVFGPRQSPESDYAAAVPRFVTACLDARPITVFGDGEQTRDFIYVEDVAAACLLAADAERAVGQVINVAGGRRVSVNEIVDTVKRLTGCGVAQAYLDARSGDVRHSEADVAKAIELLKFVPQVDLESGLERTIAHFRSPEEMA